MTVRLRCFGQGGKFQRRSATRARSYQNWPLKSSPFGEEGGPEIDKSAGYRGAFDASKVRLGGSLAETMRQGANLAKSSKAIRRHPLCQVPSSQGVEPQRSDREKLLAFRKVKCRSIHLRTDERTARRHVRCACERRAGDRPVEGDLN